MLFYVQTLRDRGYYPSSVYFLSNPDLLKRVKEISPETKTIYRIQGVSESPFYAPGIDPVQLARLDFGKVKNTWAWVGADFYEAVNEYHNVPVEFKVAYLLEFLRLADENGFNLLIAADAPGQPTLDEYSHYMPLYTYLKAHPNHAYSRHVYGIDKLLSESGDFLGYRFKLEHEIIPFPNVYLTEAQSYNGRIAVPCNVWVNDVMKFKAEVDKLPYIKGFNLFTVSSPLEWWEINDCLDELLERLP